MAEKFKGYLLPWIETGLRWHFRIDPKDEGIKGNWPGLTAVDLKTWDFIRTDYSWEKPGAEFSGPADLKAQREKYDGIGWYAAEIQVPEEWKDREVLLYFGAVNNSALVYVNGSRAGEETGGGRQALHGSDRSLS